MLNRKNVLFLSGGLMLLSGSYAMASPDCIKLTGNIHTTVMDPTSPFVPTLGTLRLRADGDRKNCGIQGHATAFSPEGLPVELTHQIACKDHTTFRTLDVVTEAQPINQCEVKVVEESTLIPGPGDFAGYEGTTRTMGTINRCTGANDFTFRGKLCPASE